MPKESHDATEGKNILLNLLVMVIGFAIFGIIIYVTMMTYEWLNICTDIMDCYDLGYID